MKKTILIKRIIPLIVFILFAFVSFVYATEWNTNSKSNFDEGIYNQTFYNDSGFVQLNATYTTGNYTSKIFDTGEVQLGIIFLGGVVMDLNYQITKQKKIMLLILQTCLVMFC